MSYSTLIKGYEPPVGRKLLDICFLVAGKLKFPNYNDQLSPDGCNVDGTTGILNYYAFQTGFPLPVEQVVKTLTDLHYGVGPTRLDTSAIYNCPVYRIPILQNPWESIEEAPSFNIANGNYAHFLRVLALPQVDGWWDVDTLKARLDCIGSSQIQANTRQGSVDQHGGLTIVDGGCDFERINSYLQRLEAVVDFAKARGYKHVSFA